MLNVNLRGVSVKHQGFSHKLRVCVSTFPFVLATYTHFKTYAHYLVFSKLSSERPKFL